MVKRLSKKMDATAQLLSLTDAPQQIFLPIPRSGTSSGSSTMKSPNSGHEASLTIASRLQSTRPAGRVARPGVVRFRRVLDLSLLQGVCDDPTTKEHPQPPDSVVACASCEKKVGGTPGWRSGLQRRRTGHRSCDQACGSWSIAGAIGGLLAYVVFNKLSCQCVGRDA